MEKLKREETDTHVMYVLGPTMFSFCKQDYSQAQRAFDLLFEYQKTGLEPDEIRKIKADVEAGYLKQAARRYGVPVDRLRSLAQADRDGRLVVLPVPVGTGKIVYRVYEADNGERRIRTIECDRLDSLEIWYNPAREVVIEADGWEIRASDVGKTVFMTYEEAEAALEGGDEG